MRQTKYTCVVGLLYHHEKTFTRWLLPLQLGLQKARTWNTPEPATQEGAKCSGVPQPPSLALPAKYGLIRTL